MQQGLLASELDGTLQILVNPSAGEDKPILSILARVLAGRGELPPIHVLRSAADFEARLAELAGAPGTVVVSGGDGSVSIAAARLRGTPTRLAVLPGGTGNVIAQELGLPLDYESAARALFEGRVVERRMDLVTCADRTSILRVGLGVDGALMESADRSSKDRLGWGAYLAAAVQQMASGVRTHYRIEVDGREYDRVALTVLLLNSALLGRGGGRLIESASPFDGRLQMIVVRDASIGAIAAVLRNLTGSEDSFTPLERNDPNAVVESTAVESVRITPTDAVPMHIDGDPRPRLEAGCSLDASIQPGALRIVAPAILGARRSR